MIDYSFTSSLTISCFFKSLTLSLTTFFVKSLASFCRTSCRSSLTIGFYCKVYLTSPFLFSFYSLPLWSSFFIKSMTLILPSSLPLVLLFSCIYCLRHLLFLFQIDHCLQPTMPPPLHLQLITSASSLPQFLNDLSSFVILYLLFYFLAPPIVKIFISSLSSSQIQLKSLLLIQKPFQHLHRLHHQLHLPHLIHQLLLCLLIQLPSLFLSLLFYFWL